MQDTIEKSVNKQASKCNTTLTELVKKGINSGTSEILSKGITPVDHLQKTNTMMEDISVDAESFCPYGVHIPLFVHSVPTAKLL